MANHICDKDEAIKTICLKLEKLEKEREKLTIDMTLLIDKVDSLISVLKVIGVLFGGAIITAFGFLITYWVKG